MSLGELAACIAIAGEGPYVWQICKGRVRPERASWFIWSVILLAALWSSHASGAADSLWFIAAEFGTCMAIFLLSLWRGSGGLTKLDVTCIALALAGVLLWQITDRPGVAIAAVIAADIFGAIPTVLKSLRQPASESATTFATSALAAALAVCAVNQWDPLLLIYPAYLCIVNIIVAAVIWTGQYRDGLLRQADTEPETG